jgi:predicted Fe-Mo cluster-binding NifX family protein
VGELVDGIIVGGIGMGALMKLQAAGITVYRAAHPTVAETIAAFKNGTLQPVGEDGACASHQGHHGH